MCTREICGIRKNEEGTREGNEWRKGEIREVVACR